MPRTEKKFGQVNQAAAGSSAELVPTSSNRRNVLLNLTGSSSATATAFTTTGSPAPAVQLAISSLTTPSSVAVVQTGSPIGYAVNVAKTKLTLFGVGTSGGYTIAATTSGAVLTSVASYTHDTFWGAIDAGNSGSLNRSLGGNGTTGSRIIFIDDEYMLAFSADTGSNTTAASGYRYGMLRLSAANALTSVSSNYTTPSGLTDATMQRNVAVGLQHATGTTGVGYILAMHNTAATNTNAVELMGMYLYASGAESGRVWWSGTGTANKTASAAAQFFSTGDYNSTYPAFAFPHTTDATSPWLGTVATGGSGSIATNLPSIPSGASNAGFRIVAADGAFAEARKYLDGTVSYPAAPTGVTVPTASLTTPQVASLKFSPNGQYLAVMYNKTAAATSTATSVVVIYTRQGNGTYSHTHSSGTAIVRAGLGSDSMAWSSDSSTIYVYLDKVATSDAFHSVQAWNPFAGDSSVNISTKSSTTIHYTKYPRVPSYTSPTLGTSSLITTDTVARSVAVAGGTNSSAAGIAHIPLSGYAGNVILMPQSELVAGLTTSVPNLVAKVGTVTTAPNYVNTIAQAIPVDSGTVVQVSGAVLESGERIYIEPSVSDAVDAVAYGVEIS